MCECANVQNVRMNKLVVPAHDGFETVTVHVSV